MFFSVQGEYPAGGLFSAGHFILLALTIILIAVSLKKTLAYSFQRIRKIIKNLIILLSALEVSKIYFNFKTGNASNLMNWMPLYFCTICIYAGWLSCFTKGPLKHLGDVFLSTGSLIGGICFLLYPSSSIMLYPTFHFLTLHSFFYHGAMVYIGVLMNRSGLVVLHHGDLKEYAAYVTMFCMFCWWLNNRYHTNFMFISDTFHGTMLDIPYRILGPLYTPMAIIVQAIVPYEVTMWFKTKTTLLTRPSWYGTIQEKELCSVEHSSMRKS
jgi:hypothetical protein